MASDPIEVLRKSLPPGYSLGGVIAAGGQGAVFRGTWRAVPVALKLFSTIDVERLRREVDLLSKSGCDYLVRLLDFFTVRLHGAVVPVAVYEFVDGPTVRQLIAQGSGRTGLRDVLRLGAHVGTAIDHLWTHRIVHRDVKPENIISCSDGRFVLVDVGFAQHLNLRTITAGGQPGTNGYRSPEQCGGRRRLTIHSDVFSLGVTMFEYATGRHPWNRNQSIMGRMSAAPLSNLRPDFDSQTITVIHAMLQGVPARRPLDIGRRFSALLGGS